MKKDRFDYYFIDKIKIEVATMKANRPEAPLELDRESVSIFYQSCLDRLLKEHIIDLEEYNSWTCPIVAFNINP